MRMRSTRPGFAGYMSEHRFRLALLAYALALAAMLTMVYGTVSFTRSGPAPPFPQRRRSAAPEWSRCRA
jgi:hypothetical protein